MKTDAVNKAVSVRPMRRAKSSFFRFEKKGHFVWSWIGMMIKKGIKDKKKERKVQTI